MLGLQWDLLTDNLKIKKYDVGIEDPLRKRKLSHVLASFFDPLGLFCPCTLSAKLLIRRLWTKKLEWDQPLDSEDVTEWRRIMKEWD